MTSKEPADKRVLVGTLYSGENEFQLCKESIGRQFGVIIEHLVIENLPNKEAHDRLYREFSKRADDFDLMIKLDADMVFNTDFAVKAILDVFEKDDAIDQVEMSVYDWFSDSCIMGVHAFSRNVYWEDSEEELFVDISPRFPGRKLNIHDAPAPLVNHCPDPSLFQAYHFGVHRALKVVQPSRYWSYEPGQTRVQWKYLQSVWHHFNRKGDVRLGYAILGAQHVFEGRVAVGQYSYTNPELEIFFQSFRDFELSDLEGCLEKNWTTNFSRRKMLLLSILPRALFGAFRRMAVKVTGGKKPAISNV